jgi:RsiW-degrading membrane proteinase PrsW (M82 family)
VVETGGPDRSGQPGRQPPTGAIVGTILFVLVVIAAIFASGLGGIGLLILLFVAESSIPLAAPGILLLVLICLPLILIAWGKRRSGRVSRSFRLPGPLPIAAAVAAAIVLGQLARVGEIWPLTLLTFWLAAALPPIVPLALASRRLVRRTTWRRAIFALSVGGLLSTSLTLLLGGIVTAVAYALVLPLRQVVAQVVASPDLERLFFSPALATAMVGTAVVAPVLEELTKPIGAILVGRRLRGPGEAFLIGMAGGVGFAAVENMLYESTGTGLWAAISTLRGVGGVLHPLNAGLVALGWYGVISGSGPGRWARLLALYGLAVGIHALWNGGLTLLFSAAGAYFFATDSWRVDVYGLGQPGIVLVFMVLEAVALWRLLVLTTDQLAGGPGVVDPGLRLHLERPGRLAVWATGLLLVIVPIGALYGPLLARYADRLVPLR